jgi:hypothetical protein
MQKFPVDGILLEFISSVPSLCHCTKGVSNTVPSAIPALPSERNYPFHSPMIGSVSKALFENRACRWLGKATHPAEALAAKMTPSIVNARSPPLQF